MHPVRREQSRNGSRAALAAAGTAGQSQHGAGPTGQGQKTLVLQLADQLKREHSTSSAKNFCGGSRPERRVLRILGCTRHGHGPRPLDRPFHG